MSEHAYRDIRYEVIGPVARICHARPNARNAEGTPLRDEQDEALSCTESSHVFLVKRCCL